jgi:hypothetical protein
MAEENQSEDFDRCPTCLRGYEIVALKFRLLRGPLILMVCASCGIVQSEKTGREMPGRLSRRGVKIRRERIR